MIFENGCGHDVPVEQLRYCIDCQIWECPKCQHKELTPDNNEKKEGKDE